MEDNNITFSTSEVENGEIFAPLYYKEIEKEVLGIDKAAEVWHIRELWLTACKLQLENNRLKKIIKKMKKRKDPI